MTIACDTLVAQPGTVRVYPAPAGAALSTQYVVRVNGQLVDVYSAPIWEPGAGRSFGGPYSFAYFDMAGKVEVAITTSRALDHLHVLPAARGIKPTVTGDMLKFTLESPGQLAIEPDAKTGPLLLFANPLEQNPPQPGDPGVVYFGPGLHKPSEIVLGDNQTLYIAGGAVVKGGINAQGTNIRITGRGILDGLDWAPKKGPVPSLVSVTLSTNVVIEGIILKDSWEWTAVLKGCRNVHMNNVKICSARCENNDGIGVVNSQQVRIENCFIRTDDDCLTAKGFGWPDRDKARDGAAVEDLTVSHCILWTDRAHIWRLGCESWAAGMRRLAFLDIDVLHWDGPRLITLQPAEEMLMEDVRFEDIRVNGEGQSELIEVYPAPTQWARRRKTPGNVRNVTFKNLTVTGTSPGHTGRIIVSGCDTNHTVEGLTFDNVVRYGVRVTKDAPDVLIQANTKDIVFK